MLFNSLQYSIFLPCVVLLYYLLPHKTRWAFLLLSSYFFYSCWNVKYALLMLISTVITYTSGILIDSKSQRNSQHAERNKKIFVALSFFSNLAILFFFKYYGFVADGLQSVFAALRLSLRLPDFSILLPVGISFYTFQALSYTMDVYRGDVACQRHFGKYALFISFFPQLVAGPIERSSSLLSQFDEIHLPDAGHIRDGLWLIIVGMFKKLVIADRLALFVDEVYNHVGAYGVKAYLVATLFFAFQIYCDFGGYSDIAIGSARLMGFRLMRNFKHPYLSRSINEFWKRWHISLSSWFKDYLYIPLGGNRVSVCRWCFNIMVVFLISGLWHGANWTFLLWGALHGMYQIIGHLTQTPRNKLFAKIGLPEGSNKRTLLQMLCTFGLVTCAWGLFRVNSLSDLGVMFSHLLDRSGHQYVGDMISKVGTPDFILSCVLIAALMVADLFCEKMNPCFILKKRALPVRWATYLFMLLSIILFGVYGNLTNFIYFQF